MIADTAESLIISAVGLVVLALNVWNARRLDRKHAREAGEFR